TKRSFAGLIVAMMATGTLGAGTVVGVDTYHDMSTPTGTQQIAVESVVTSGATADTYHDM
ncbi:MAG TPA: hypothetical protein VFM54_21720, partial [Micromonosporaceae bacterium]|nr:hypothetical protein [Micromonosporaceae bacterium]